MQRISGTPNLAQRIIGRWRAELPADESGLPPPELEFTEAGLVIYSRPGFAAEVTNYEVVSDTTIRLLTEDPGPFDVRFIVRVTDDAFELAEQSFEEGETVRFVRVQP